MILLKYEKKLIKDLNMLELEQICLILLLNRRRDWLKQRGIEIITLDTMLVDRMLSALSRKEVSCMLYGSKDCLTSNIRRCILASMNAGEAFFNIMSSIFLIFLSC